MHKQNRSFSKSIGRSFYSKNVKFALIILLIPMIWIISLIESPMNWIIGISIEILFIIYLVVKLRIMHAREKPVENSPEDMNANAL